MHRRALYILLDRAVSSPTFSYQQLLNRLVHPSARSPYIPVDSSEHRPLLMYKDTHRYPHCLFLLFVSRMTRQSFQHNQYTVRSRQRMVSHSLFFFFRMEHRRVPCNHSWQCQVTVRYPGNTVHSFRAESENEYYCFCSGTCSRSSTMPERRWMQKASGCLSF